MTHRFTIDEGNGQRAATDAEVLDAAKAILRRRFRRGTPLNSPRVAREHLALTYSATEHELFIVLFLDTRHRLIASRELFRGTIDGASVHPREVVKEALALNAAAVILAHNHPSGVAEPSTADEVLTQRLKEALGVVDIRVIDHLIAAGGECVSLAERGLV